MLDIETLLSKRRLGLKTHQPSCDPNADRNA